MITGFVFSGQRKPVVRAQVELRSDTFASLRRTETDNSGRFIFVGVGTGRFQVRVTVPGSDLEEQSQPVEIVSGAGGGSGDTAQMEFNLAPRMASQLTRQGAGAIFAQDVPEDAKKRYQSGITELDAGRVESGIVELEAATTIFPTYFAALERLGVEYMKKKRYEDARKAFTTGASVNARSYNSWYGLSYANFALERSEDSIAAAEKAIEIDRLSYEVYFVMGMSQRRLKRYEAAEKSFLKAVELDKTNNPDVHWNLALLYGKNLSKFGKAADELETFLKLTPDNPDAANIRKLIATFRAKQ